MKIKWSYFFLYLIFLTSCAMTTGEKMSKLSPGMSKEEVVTTLGKYDGYKKYGDFEILSYNHRYASGWAHDRADYNVVLQHNKVTEWGQGEVRVKEMGGVQTVILMTPFN